MSYITHGTSTGDYLTCPTCLKSVHRGYEYGMHVRSHGGR